MARHHDYRGVEVGLAGPLFEQRDAVGVGQPDVEEDQVRTPRPSRLARLRRVSRDAHREALVFQDVADEKRDVRLVVDHQDVGRTVHRAASRRAPALAPGPTRVEGGGGNCMTTEPPPSRRFSAQTRPLCSSTIFLTMASPRPVPFCLEVV